MYNNLLNFQAYTGYAYPSLMITTASYILSYRKCNCFPNFACSGPGLCPAI